jgi:2'-5' RNA ligase
MALRNYSLWLMPRGAVNRKFSELISQLAEQYSSPKFPPHVTLVGSIEAHEEEMILKTQEVAQLIHHFVIRLANIDYTDQYYRTLFVRVESSADILVAYQEARKIFPSDQETNYAPHLSLLYGNFSVETKEQIIKKIGASFKDEFEANILHLYLTDGEVNTWRKISEFPLRG